MLKYSGIPLIHTHTHYTHTYILLTLAPSFKPLYFTLLFSSPFSSNPVHIRYRCYSINLGNMHTLTHKHTHTVCLTPPLARHRCPALLFSLFSSLLPCLVAVFHVVTSRYASLYTRVYRWCASLSSTMWMLVSQVYHM